MYDSGTANAGNSNKSCLTGFLNSATKYVLVHLRKTLGLLLLNRLHITLHVVKVQGKTTLFNKDNK